MLIIICICQSIIIYIINKNSAANRAVMPEYQI